MLVAVCLAALLIRIGIAVRTEVINTDGPLYLVQAKAILDGDFRAALKGSSSAPGTAAGIALLARCGLPLEAAGWGLSALAAALVVFPLHAIARRGFGPSVALATVLIYVVAPVPARLGAQIYSTSLFLLLVVTAVAFALSVLHRAAVSSALLCGTAIALSYATRVDGLVVLPLAFLACLRAPATTRRRLLLAGAVALPTLLAVAGYSLFVASEHGVWITKKFTPEEWSHYLTLALPSRYALSGIWEDLTETLFVPFVPLALAAVFVRPAPEGRKTRVAVLLLCLVWAACLVRLCQSTGAMSKRYTTPMVVLLLPWVACGLLAVARALARLVRRAEPCPRWITATFVVLACAACVPKLLRLHEGDAILEKLTGEYLRRLDDRGEAILCGSTRVPYYAGTSSVPVRWARLEPRQVYRALRVTNVKYVVRDRGLIDFAPEFANGLGPPDATLVAEITSPACKSRVSIFRIEAPAAERRNARK